MLVKNVRRRLSRPRDCGGISQAKTGSSAKASASTSPSRAASSRRAARTAWEPPRGEAVSWVIGPLSPACRLAAGSPDRTGIRRPVGWRWWLWAGDGLRGAYGVGRALGRAVAAVDGAEAAAADVVDVQVAAGGEHLEGVGAVGVGDGDLAVVRGCAGAVNDRGAARAGQAGMDAGEGPGRGAGGRVEGY